MSPSPFEYTVLVQTDIRRLQRFGGTGERENTLYACLTERWGDKCDAEYSCSGTKSSVIKEWKRNLKICFIRHEYGRERGFHRDECCVTGMLLFHTVPFVWGGRDVVAQLHGY
jgi:hypothetical protein